jgi:gliding motility-associated-like protein
MREQSKNGMRMLLLLIAASVCGTANAQLLINEYSCANKDGLITRTESKLDRGTVKQDAGYDDWIELYNAGNTAVSLQGYFLSDKANKLNKYQIPGNLSIPAQGKMIFVASDRNGYFDGYHHTNFKLTQSNGKDKIILSYKNEIKDSVSIIPTFKNHSRGRMQDGAAQWGIFENPTPSTSNINGKSRYLNTPVFSSAAGFLAAATSIRLSSDEQNAAIVYTTDGSDPRTSTTSKTYSSPIAVTNTTVIRAAAKPISGNYTLCSNVTTNTYFINTRHELPVISLCSDQFGDFMKSFAKPKIELAAAIEYFDKNKTRKFNMEGGVKAHGNDSWFYDQKGMRFYARDEYGTGNTIHEKLFSSSDRDKFDCIILRAAGSDNYPGFSGSITSTHIRDGFAQTLAEQNNLNLDVRRYEPCVVYLNGKYWGVYEMRERVDEDFAAYYYDQKKGDIDMLSYYGGLSIEAGSSTSGADVAWSDLYTYITTKDMANTANYNYVASQLDVMSMIDYFCLNTFLVNSDWLNWNTAWWRGNTGTGVKWRYRLWDEDNIFNLGQNFTDIPNLDASTANACDVQGLGSFQNAGAAMGHVDMFNALQNNPEFHRLYLNRYADLMNSAFNKESMIQHLDAMVAKIQPEMESHCARWEPNNANSYLTWLANVQLLRDQINMRADKVMASMDTCYSVKPVKGIVVNIEPAGAGSVMVNTFTPEAFPASLTYFNGVKVNMTALAADNNFQFSHWEVKHSTVLNRDNAALQIAFSVADTLTAIFVPVKNISDANMEAAIAHHNVRPVSIDRDLDTNPVAIEKEDESKGPEHPVKLASDKSALPNVFSPNGDGINDVLKVLGADLSNFSMTVFNRSGSVIFYATNQQEGWDGTFGGTLCANGLYTVEISGISMSDTNPVHLSSSVSLIR